jgi:xanthine dehydrogenase small subunit
MRAHISFYLNGELHTVRDFDPTRTLLRYLREDLGLIGTKEGCAEGDCGACTLMVSDLTPSGDVRHRPINACIGFLPSFDGMAITTIEALNTDAAGREVQKAMVENHGSQCGFCTPGIVMSLYTAVRKDTDLSRQGANNVLAGNLCRCTGYGPILKAAETLGHRVDSGMTNLDSADLTRLQNLQHNELIAGSYGERRFFCPANIDQLGDLCIEYPEATLVAGATDVGLWVTKAHRELPTLIFLGRVAEMKSLSVTSDEIRIGAGVSYTDALEVLAQHYPDLGELIRRIGSVQVRSAGTIGGNIANGSPIGDMPPALIALGATVDVRHGTNRRSIPLEDYFIEYGRQDRRDVEFVEALCIPLNASPHQLRCYKISKRFDQDISGLCGCFNIAIEDGRVIGARIAYGGMAGIPKRAAHVEAALIGQPWTAETIKAALPEFERDFEPMTDMRASSEYRRTAARNLLLKYHAETLHPLIKTRLVGHGSQLS